MPRLARVTIKTAMLYLVAGLLAALALALGPVLGWPGALGALRPVMLHLLVVGWITQLIFGVAYWMFPKWTKTQPRGNELLAWAVFALLNAGLLLRMLAEPLHALQPAAGLGPVLAAAAALQVAAGWLFVANTWRRVKER